MIRSQTLCESQPGRLDHAQKGEGPVAAKSYTLDFSGYWREPNIGGIPAQSGVYCAYACTYNPSEKNVSLRLLIYIGEAANAKDRVAGHGKWNDWRRHLQQGEQICFSFAPVASADRERVEAAMIFRHKPPENAEYRDSFPFDQTTVTTTGRNALLDSSFTLYRTP